MDHLLILAPNWLGDAVMALPAIADIHRASPGTAITVAARPAIAPLFSLVPHVRDVVVLDGSPKGSPYVQSAADVARASDVARGFRSADLGAGSRAYDTALLLPNSFRSALIVARAGIPERWGYRTEWRGALLTRAIDRAPAGLHQVEYYQYLVHALGFPNGPVEPTLDAPAATRERGADLLARAGWDRQAPLVALAPGAAYGGAKRWPPESFAELARALADDGATMVMVGSAADAATGKEIAARAGGSRIVNLIGATDLPTLAGVLAICRAMVSNDSGAMHLAAALGVRVTAAFGPTDEMATGPRGQVRLKADTTEEVTGDAVRGVRLPRDKARGRQPDHQAQAHAVVTHPVWCRPCLLRECPLDHACMRGVRVDAMLAEARRTL